MIRAPLVVVVGVCAVGKTTLVNGLRDLGFSALEIGQEHSDVPYLWARSDPAFVVYLDADDALLQRRRNYLTPQKLARERCLLSYARSQAHLAIDATTRRPSEVLDEVTLALQRAGVTPIQWQPERPFEHWGESS